MSFIVQVAQLAVNIIRLLYEIWRDRHKSDCQLIQPDDAAEALRSSSVARKLKPFT